MSLILEALQRADQERQPEQAVPGIDSTHALHLPAGNSNQRTFTATNSLAIALGLLLALVVYLLWRQTYQQGSEVAAVAPAQTAVPAENRSMAATAPAAADSPLPPRSTPAGAGARPDWRTRQQNAGNAAAPAALNDLYAEARKEQQRRTDVAAPAKAPAQPTAPQPTNTVAAAQLAALEAAANAAADPAPAAEDPFASIPFASQLAVAERSGIPELRYTTHGYSKDTDNGVVTLNGKSLRRGDTVTAGLVLLEIKEDYIVLDQNGLVFRLPAATDWRGR